MKIEDFRKDMEICMLWMAIYQNNLDQLEFTPKETAGFADLACFEYVNRFRDPANPVHITSGVGMAGEDVWGSRKAEGEVPEGVRDFLKALGDIQEDPDKDNSI